MRLNTSLWLVLLATVLIGCDGTQYNADASPDAFVSLDGGPDAGLDGMSLDAAPGLDASRDTEVLDAGDGALCTDTPMVTPPPETPQCTVDQSACYRLCTNVSCLYDCMSMVGPVSCFECISSQFAACILTNCGDTYATVNCCYAANCDAGAQCPACASQETAFFDCETAAFVPYCQPAIAPCLTPA